uniref:Reverse transcriptase domain-containing protein n=1 Tax=Plectus sambesii TaxID=2011161 RepID=A0A914WJ47_9BILA
MITDAAQLDATLAALISEVLAAQPEPARRPPPRRDAADPARQRRRRRSGPQYDAANAARIQWLYRANHPRAFREISPPSSFCEINQYQVQTHFTDVLKHRTQTDSPMPSAIPQLPPPPLEDQDHSAISSHQQKSGDASATAPTRHQAQTLWKESTTILLHKDGDRDNISNWRPIALSDTIGKLYSSCLAARLTNWCLRHDWISTAQKGFMPYERCLKHNFVLQSCIQDARTSCWTCTIAWLDLRNAFGSVPHNTIFKCLQWTGLSTASINVIRQLYNNCSMAIRVTEGLTERIVIGAGVKQGCPLSPIVFNITIEPILQEVLRPAMATTSRARRLLSQKILQSNLNTTMLERPQHTTAHNAHIDDDIDVEDNTANDEDKVHQGAIPVMPQTQQLSSSSNTSPGLTSSSATSTIAISDISIAISIIKKLYNGCSTAFRLATSLTKNGMIKAGMKQGCPLSRIVFNIAIEPIIRAVQRLQRGYLLHGVKHDVLAYADDLVLISGSVAGLQRMLDMTSWVAMWAGLTFNLLKCASLHVDGKKQNAPRMRFSIQHGTMLALGIDDFYEHLGVPTGFTIHQSALEMLKRMKEEVRQVDGSLLAPWQKFDALNTFVLPRLSFHLK